MSKMYPFFLAGVFTLASSPLVAAEKVGSRHGSIPTKNEAIAFEGGATLTYQHASDSRADDELLASVDMVSVVPTNNGQWLIHLEGNASPDNNGVANLFGEANGDAGSALDRDGDGRLQVSELHYLWYLGKDAIVAGLIDPAGPLDNSDIANDETGQFIGGSLVNNPTIAFPDYTLGAVYLYKPANENIDLTFLVGGSHGLADNPDASYSELVDLGETGKGVFAAAEVAYQQGSNNWRVGAWAQTADNEYVDGSGKTGDNYGIYTSSDHELDQYRLNVRLGLANDKVSEAAGFVGLAIDRAVGKNQVGAGITRTYVSNEAGSGKDDITQFELYYRLNLAENFTVTPSIQSISNSGFDSTNSSIDDDVSVFSVRANYTF